MYPRMSSALTAVLFVLASATVTRGQEEAEAPPAAEEPVVAFAEFVGEVTGNRVYVRSGPDVNYYPVAQLDAGARVQVVGESYGWMRIVPPTGCYSLMEKTYVDRGTGELGVVNGNAVWVRTGSDMSPAKYARQLKLDRGAEVTILGEADGYYKIKPPPGAHVYISGQYVQRVPEEMLALGSAGSAESPGGTAIRSAAEGGPARPESPQLARQAGPVEARPALDVQATIDAIEAQLAAEVAKPLATQSFGGLIEQLTSLAASASDEAIRQYADRRLEQLAQREKTLELWTGVQLGAERLGTDLQSMMERRAQLRLQESSPQPRFDVTGEFRKSMIFSDSPVLPQRYLLVDPSASPARTIAYVEIPPASSLNPKLYLGRMVGVVASRRYYHKGTIDAIEVFVPREIVILTEAPAPSPPEQAPAAEPSASPANAPVTAQGTKPPDSTP